MELPEASENTLDKFLFFSVPQFPHLQNGNNRVSFIGFMVPGCLKQSVQQMLVAAAAKVTLATYPGPEDSTLYVNSNTCETYQPGFFGGPQSGVETSGIVGGSHQCSHKPVRLSPWSNHQNHPRRAPPQGHLICSLTCGPGHLRSWSNPQTKADTSAPVGHRKMCISPGRALQTCSLNNSLRLNFHISKLTAQAPRNVKQKRFNLNKMPLDLCTAHTIGTRVERTGGLSLKEMVAGPQPRTSPGSWLCLPCGCPWRGSQIHQSPQKVAPPVKLCLCDLLLSIMTRNYVMTFVYRAGAALSLQTSGWSFNHLSKIQTHNLCV